MPWTLKAKGEAYEVGEESRVKSRDKSRDKGRAEADGCAGLLQGLGQRRADHG